MRIFDRSGNMYSLYCSEYTKNNRFKFINFERYNHIPNELLLNITIVEQLFENGSVDSIAYTNYDISYASANRHLNVVNKLLKRPTVDDKYTIRYSSIDGRLIVVYTKYI